jgi:hypothetical protein
VIYAFVNGQLASSTIQNPAEHLSLSSLLTSHPISLTIEVPAGDSTLDILSVSMGLNNYGDHMEENQVGAVSNITLDGKSLFGFTHSIGLTGEADKSALTPISSTETCTQLCWFNMKFNTPNVDVTTGLSTIALDIGESHLTKGAFWVNGNMIGRYWTIVAERGCQVCEELTYSGEYGGESCRRGCGEMSQRYYKVPSAWLNTPER